MLVDDPVIRDQDSRYWGEPNGISGHEIDEGLCRNEDVPRRHGPGADYSTHVLTSADINILSKSQIEIERLMEVLHLGEQCSQICCYRDGIGGDIDPNRGNQKSSSTEERCRPSTLPRISTTDIRTESTTHLRRPIVDDQQRIP